MLWTLIEARQGVSLRLCHSMNFDFGTIQPSAYVRQGFLHSSLIFRIGWPNYNAKLI